MHVCFASDWLKTMGLLFLAMLRRRWDQDIGQAPVLSGSKLLKEVP